MDKEKEFLDKLNDTEFKIYHYIKDKTDNGKEALLETTTIMAENIDSNNAAISRGVTKLKDLGILSVVPAVDKFKKNKIHFFGVQSKEEQEKSIKDIVSTISELNLVTERFERVFNAKDKEIDELKAKLAESDRRYDELERKSKDKDNILKELAGSVIISKRDMGNGTIAIMLKKSNK